jgi:hypothetical protein
VNLLLDGVEALAEGGDALHVCAWGFAHRVSSSVTVIFL